MSLATGGTATWLPPAGLVEHIQINLTTKHTTGKQHPQHKNTHATVDSTPNDRTPPKIKLP